jgi:ATP-binding cassette subfamily B multidrug efflux pump
MLRLLRYLKPYALFVVISIVLLFVQANAELALPDYLSRIVNNGIQQGGLVDSVPGAIRAGEMNKLVLFLSPVEKTQVLDSYLLVDSTSASYEQYVAEYPQLSKEPIYVLKSIDNAQKTNLNPILGKAFLVVTALQQVLSDPSKVATLAQGMGIDLTKIPAGADLFSLLPNLPASVLSQISSAMNQKFSNLGESMINQMAVGAVKSEYAALGMDTTKIQTQYILKTGGMMLLLTLLSVVCTIIVGYLAARTAAGVGRDLRQAVFKKVESFSATEFEKFSTASLITRSTNDVTQMQMVTFMFIRMIFFAPIIGVGGVIRAIGKGANMWWLIALAVLVLFGIIMLVFSISLPRFKRIQNLIDRLNLVTRENLSGMMVIRAFNMQPFEEDRFDKANQDLTKTMLFINRVMVVMMPIMMFIMNVLSILIIWVGAHQIAEATMQVGDMMAFMQYAMQILFSFMMLSMLFIILPRASVSGERIADVLETEVTIQDPPKPKQFPKPFQGIIEFRDVSFRYPGAEADVLHELNFIAKPGQTTAFIGTTGSGKSTIVSLIPRFHEVTQGAIYVNSTNIREVTQHDLRDHIGYVPQKSSLFSGTIESNLRYADENAIGDVLKKATDIAQASEFIQEKPEGLQSEISQGGTNVSGGQKQRLAIARALVKQPPIYIFDDSFSSLDFKTDAALRRALKESTGDSTVLIVTQRISTIMNSEQIIVLDEGSIVGKGTHQELMKTCEVYKGIALSQLSKEELA